MNIVFLDYDGVVNTPMWDEKGEKCSYSFPKKNIVNNFQSVQWVSEFCQKYGYSIVVTSSWRHFDNYKDCLINGGLRKGIEIIGRTPHLPGEHRGNEISKYLSEHPEVDNFLIFDDESDMEDLKDHLIMCEGDVGFCLKDFSKAEELHKRMSEVKK